jgi:hypothetical protein
MANYYKLSISFELRENLLASEKAALNHFINGSIERPEELPVHDYFLVGNEKNLISIPSLYKTFVTGEYCSIYWINDNSHGITLLLPGIRDLEGWYQRLKFVGWLCSMSQKDCYLGYISQEYDDFSMSLLYSIRNKLYFKDIKKLKNLNSFSTGEPL